MSKRLDANNFGFLVGALISALLGLALIVVILWPPQSLLLILLVLTPLIGVAFYTASWWLHARRLNTASIQRMRHGQCPKCEYDLTGNVSGICPECGTPIVKDVLEKLTTDPPKQ